MKIILKMMMIVLFCQPITKWNEYFTNKDDCVKLSIKNIKKIKRIYNTKDKIYVIELKEIVK